MYYIQMQMPPHTQVEFCGLETNPTIATVNVCFAWPKRLLQLEYRLAQNAET